MTTYVEKSELVREIRIKVSWSQMDSIYRIQILDVYV